MRVFVWANNTSLPLTLLKLILSADVKVGGIAVSVVFLHLTMIFQCRPWLMISRVGSVRKSIYFWHFGLLVNFGVWAYFLMSWFALPLCSLPHVTHSIQGIPSFLRGFSLVELWSVDALQPVCQYLGLEYFTQEFSEAVWKMDHFVISEGIGI